MDLRVSVQVSMMHGVNCNLCTIKGHNVRLVYFNILPYTMYVKTLKGEISIYRNADYKWNETTCDLTEERFIPGYAIFICNECYVEYFGPYYDYCEVELNE